MNNLNTAAIKATVLLNLVLCSGCFYLIEEGKGGTAERFSQSQWLTTNNGTFDSAYTLRLQQCKQHLKQYHNSAQYLRHPTHFQEISSILILSQRMHSAKFYAQAKEHLQQAEDLLLALKLEPLAAKKAKKTTKINL